MKLLINTIVLTLFLAVSATTNAQVAYYNSNDLVKVMPEYMEVMDSVANLREAGKGASEDLENQKERLERDMISEGDEADEAEVKGKMNELEAKAAEAQQEESAAVRAAEKKLLEPLYAKVHAAAEKVAKENDFKKTYDTAQESKPPKKEWANISSGILKELGLQK